MAGQNKVGVPATTKMPKGASVYACNCEHKFQDKQYGKGQRLMNEAKEGPRCTVCSKVKGK